MNWEQTTGADEAKKRSEEKRKELLAAEVTADFEKRREDRRRVESGWILNMNFLSGNQYLDIAPEGGIVEEDKRFYWQSRRVFNHIAPTVDSRIAKLTKLRPQLRVQAFSEEEDDRRAAKLATGVLDYVRERIHLDETMARAITWSETCGSVFYKIVWDEEGGRQVCVDEDGEPVYEGEVDISVVPPFGIFPDRMDAEALDEVQSLIHAQVVSVDYIAEKFGVVVAGQKLDSQLTGYSEPSSWKNPSLQLGANDTAAENSVILIERYTKPTAKDEDGKLEIVAGGKLLYEGALPYINGERGERGFPFVKQDSLRLPAAFFGTSVVDRLIPLQRAYNAVRNRKHEFLSRISMGVLAVEDGSIDVDELAEEGLSPGKILVYRQGGNAPQLLDCGNVPSEFAAEEDRLEEEFTTVSGVSDLSQNSNPARVTSASGLQLLISQDDSRLSASIENLSMATRETGRHILRLYRQFAGNARLMTLTGDDNKKRMCYFNAAEIDADDILFETDEAITAAEKREMVLELYRAGILTDENGKLSEENRMRILDAFGLGNEL